MKFAWFIHRYHPCVGGAENYGRAMVRRFVEAGHQVDVFTSDAHDLWYFTDRSRKKIDAPPESLVDGARVHRFAVKHLPLQRYFGRALSYVPHWPTRCVAASYMPILPGLSRVRGSYDAVFAVGFPYTVFSYAAWRTAKSAGAPLLITPFLHLATPGDPVNRAYTRPHQVRLLAEAETVIVQTNLEANAVRDWNIPDDRILRLGMAVEHAEVVGGDPQRLRTGLNIPENAPVVGHLATLDPNKGTNDLVSSVAKLNQSRSASNPIVLILAGPSSPDFERFFRESSAESWPWLKRLGPLPLTDRADFFASLNVFSMPSRTDSFGIVFLEAWANGLPVVAADAGGVPDVVRDGEAGFLVPFGDLNRLSGSIASLIDDPLMARKLGEAGKKMVAQGYTWEDRFATLEGRVCKLIASQSGRPGRIPRPHRTVVSDSKAIRD